jgi:hypothetical protein
MNETTSMTTATFNGYANYETWNVSLYVLNDEGLYNTAQACVEFANPDESPWAKFVRCMMQGQIGKHLGSTPDGVAWNDPAIDTRQMEQLMADLRSGY